MEKRVEVSTPGKPFDTIARCYLFSKDVIMFLKECHFDYVHRSLVQQLIRSATSIGANVIEGRNGNSRKNLIYSLSVALRSANESRYWLSLLRDTADVKKEQINQLIAEVNELSKIIGKSIISLKTNSKGQASG